MKLRAKDPKVDELHDVELFRGCRDTELARIAGALTEAKIAAGDVLTREGRFESEQCFIIREGEVRVSRAGVELARVGPGALVGEMASIERGARSATATAVTPLKVWIFDPRSFTTVLDTMPTVGKSVIRTLANRLREADAAAVL